MKIKLSSFRDFEFLRVSLFLFIRAHQRFSSTIIPSFHLSIFRFLKINVLLSRFRIFNSPSLSLFLFKGWMVKRASSRNNRASAKREIEGVACTIEQRDNGETAHTRRRRRVSKDYATSTRLAFLGGGGRGIDIM